MRDNPSMDSRKSVGVRHFSRSCHVSYDIVVLISLTQGTFWETTWLYAGSTNQIDGN